MKKILIIDDEIEICMMLKAFLQNKKFEVDYECTLSGGINNLISKNHDILILDNNLPDGLGVQSIENIKQKSPNTIIIMLSAMTSIKEIALKKGADHFLKKPFKLNELAELLKPSRINQTIIE